MDMDPFEYLDSRGHFNINPGLERMERVMKRLKKPHLSIPAVHIGGTNGKGSTSAMVSAILDAFPIRTAIYTSPHLQDITDRLRLIGENVDREILEKAMKEVLDEGGGASFKGGLTYFELLTAASFLIMFRQGIDVNISEVGMGGRWDATNILEPQAAAITSISLDHMEYLGDDPVSITVEKCGIIKASTPVVIGEVCSLLEERERCLRTILDVCTRNGSPVVLISTKDDIDKKKYLLASYNIPDWRIISVKADTATRYTEADLQIHKPDGERQIEPKFELLDEVAVGRYRIPLLGKHQATNFGIAISLSMLVLPFAMAHSKLRSGDDSALSKLIKGCINGLMDEHSGKSIRERIRSGLKNVQLRGRMEKMIIDGKMIYVDGGHNIEAARAITNTMNDLYPERTVHLLMTMMGDKEPAEYLHELELDLRSAVLSPLPGERSMRPVKLLDGLVRSGRRCIEVHVREDIDNAIDTWLSRIGEDEIGLALGSFYLYEFIKAREDVQKV